MLSSWRLFEGLSCFYSVGCQCFGPSTRREDFFTSFCPCCYCLGYFPVSFSLLIAVFSEFSGYSLKTLAYPAWVLSAILDSSFCFTFKLFDWPIDHFSCYLLLQSAIAFNKCLRGNYAQTEWVPKQVRERLSSRVIQGPTRQDGNWFSSGHEAVEEPHPHSAQQQLPGTILSQDVGFQVLLNQGGRRGESKLIIWLFLVTANASQVTSIFWWISIVLKRLTLLISAPFPLFLWREFLDRFTWILTDVSSFMNLFYPVVFCIITWIFEMFLEVYISVSCVMWACWLHTCCHLLWSSVFIFCVQWELEVGLHPYLVNFCKTVPQVLCPSMRKHVRMVLLKWF